MVRRFLIFVVVLCALGGAALAGKGGDAVAPAADAARTAFASGLKSAEATFVGATALLTKGLAKKSTAALDATNGFGAAFAFYVASVKKLADTASASIATDASTAMTNAADETLAGAVAGDGGSLDTLSEYVETSLEAARRRAIAKARAFAKAIAKASTSGRQQMTVVVPPWPFDRRAAPHAPTAIAPIDEPIRLLLALATRLDDGTVIVTLAGGAPDSADGNFDARLVSGTDIKGVGALLSAGGLHVDHATWMVTAALNDPHVEAVTPGNRVIEFGAEPFDGQLAGRQPGAFVHGGVIGVQ